MYMAYSTNPHLPRVRMEAVKLIRLGWSTRKVALHFGFNQSTIVRWVRRAPFDGRKVIPTESSRPWHHPHELSVKMVRTILEYRYKYRRGAEVLQFLLAKDGYETSLSSVKRTLRRNGCTYPSKWKKWHKYSPRPIAEKPGILVEIDTQWDGLADRRLYVYTLLDVCSRWAHAVQSLHINTHTSLRFVRGAQSIAPFKFQTLQSDHGSEFSKWFTTQIGARDIAHRHSRVRQPNDNAHVERFNRTLQDECLRYIPRSLKSYQKEIPEYLDWYNKKRPHMGLNMKTPTEVMRSY